MMILVAFVMGVVGEPPASPNGASNQRTPPQCACTRAQFMRPQCLPIMGDHCGRMQFGHDCTWPRGIFECMTLRCTRSSASYLPWRAKRGGGRAAEATWDPSKPCGSCNVCTSATVRAG
jgi:hypothetical protein